MIKEEEELKTVNPFEGLQGDAVWEEVKKYPNIMSALDSRVSSSVNNGVENFKSKGMQEILKAEKEALRKELNPTETPEQIRIRELEEKLSNSEKQSMLSKLQDELSLKAQELDFNTIKAKDYAIWGDKALEKLEADAEWFKTELNNRLSTEIKNKYNKSSPKSSLPIANIDTRIKEARAAGNSDLALRLQMLKQTTA